MYKNDEGITTATGGIVLIVIYLFLFSLAVSFFTVQIYGVDAVNNPIQLPTSGNVKIYSGIQDYETGNFDRELLFDQNGGSWININGTGYYLESRAWLHPFAYLLIKDIQPDVTGKYDNTYEINNSVQGVYSIILRGNGGSDDSEVIVNTEGFEIPMYFYGTKTQIGSKFKFSYPNANQITDVTIRTVYVDENSAHSLDFYFNNEKLFTTTELIDKQETIFSDYHFGGVGSNAEGFVLEKFTTNNQIIKGGGDLNVVTVLLGVVTVLLKMTFWSLPYWIMPFALQVIFVSLPEAVLVICIVLAVRG